jgi:diadenylate cyclase
MGTRHRAGIGITEETDAIAIVVSEETGQISLAQAGQIDRGISVEELRERLSTLLHRFVPPTTLPSPIETADPESALGKPPEVKS